MEEILVWVMGNADGRRILIGTFGTRGLIHRNAILGSTEVRGDSRYMPERGVAREAVQITEDAERHYEMLLPPTVLRVPPSPLGRNQQVDDWVEAEVWPVIEAQMGAS